MMLLQQCNSIIGIIITVFFRHHYILIYYSDMVYYDINCWVPLLS